MQEENDLKLQVQRLIAEKAELEKCKKRLQFIESVAQEALLLFNLEHECIDVNERTLELFGCSRSEVLKKSAQDLFDSEFAEDALNRMCSKSVVAFDALMRRRDGVLFWATLCSRRLEYEGQDVRVLTCRDITLQKELQNQTLILNAEYEAILQNSQVGILFLSTEQKVQRVNRKLVDIFGYTTEEELIGKGAEILHLGRQEYEAFTAAHSADLYAGQPIKIEYQLRHKSGRAIWMSVNGQVIDKHRPPNLEQGVVWIFEDIDERKQTEEKLSQAYSELEIIFNNAMLGIMLVGKGRIIRRVNQVFANMFVMTPRKSCTVSLQR